MRLAELGLKSMAFAAALVLAACETTPEQSASTDSQGGASNASTQTQSSAAVTRRSGPPAGSQDDLAINIGDRVFFDFDRHELSAESRATVEKWASWMKQYPAVTVTLEGHCDERGTRDYNLGLGDRRATSVQQYLVALGINANRMTKISYGKERPVCDAHDESCWSRNRRTVMSVN